MKTLFSGMILFCGVAFAGAQGIRSVWATTYFNDSYSFATGRFAVFKVRGHFVEGLSVGADSGKGLSSSGDALLLVDATDGTKPMLFGTDTVLPRFATTFLRSNNPSLTGLSVAILGSSWGNLVQGSFATFYGSSSDSSNASGNLDYTYIPSGGTYSLPIGLGTYPYATYAAVAAQYSPTSRELLMLNTKAGGAKPSVEFADPAIDPSTAVFGGNLFLVEGGDMNPASHGNRRTSVYAINQDGSVNLAFTKTFVNTLSNHVFTKHSLLWGPLSGTFNVLVDNVSVHNANNGTFTYSFTLNGFDGSGRLLWTSVSRPGNITKISVGSSKSIYVLGGAATVGEFVLAYGPNGILRWSHSSRATKIASALDQGVVEGDDAVDSSGYHHIHITKYNLSGLVAWTQSYASRPTDQDFLSDLQWISGRVFAAGQIQRPGVSFGVWGAQWDQT